MSDFFKQEMTNNVRFTFDGSDTMHMQFAISIEQDK